MGKGISLPISLQISNLQDIAQQLKTFAGKNILESSFGGKKIEQELNGVLRVLSQMEVKAKNSFKVNSDFSSMENDVNKLELSLEHVQGLISNLSFEDLKIPADAQAEIEALNNRIKELNNGFLTFKASQKEKLLANTDFTAGLSSTFGKDASKILAKNYDEMYDAIKSGMTKINNELILQKAQYEANTQIVTQNSSGRENFTAWGALEWVSKAFESLPKDQSKYSEQQKMLAKYIHFDEEKQQYAFTGGARGATGFFKELASQFSLDDAQIKEIRRRVTEAAKIANKNAAEILRQAATDPIEGAKIFGNGLDYTKFSASAREYKAQLDAQTAAQEKLNQTENKQKSGNNVLELFGKNYEDVIKYKQELDALLEQPKMSLQQMQDAILQSTKLNPLLGDSFAKAGEQIQQANAQIDEGRNKLQGLNTATNKLTGVSNFINRYVGLYAIMRRVTTAVRNAFNNIKDLDKSITNIAVVTNMSQEDLWGKIGEYTKMAQQYGVATKDVYTVSQLFYQQGLQTNQVMSLTTETLKMAKISGMGYEDAANAMTVAIRAFSLEMTNAQQVTDTYSALAAKFAVSSAEIANAMEKTASSASNVGMSLQSTSAFISVMVQTTRESAQNIGSALKSIISRYGEMKASPSKLLNIDGEEVAFNKVDTALASIGISIKDASGQFRDFDDVIMELAEKWDSLDNNTQRYIATIMAGNRQQSRFIALVSNYDELKRALSTANEAENASIVQVAKTMDSLETKAQQLQNAFSQIYLDLHIEDGLKGLYTGLTNILKTIGNLGVKNGALPTLMNIIGFGAGAKSLVNLAKDKVNETITKVNLDTSDAEARARELRAALEKEINTVWNVDTSQLEAALARKAELSGQPTGTTTEQAPISEERVAARTLVTQEGSQQRIYKYTDKDGNQKIRNYRVNRNNSTKVEESKSNQNQRPVRESKGTGEVKTWMFAATAAARILGTAVTAYGASIKDKSTDKFETSKLLTGLGNGLSMAGTFGSLGLMTGNPIIGAVAAAIGLVVGGLGAAIDGMTVTLKEKLAMQQEEFEEVQNESLKQQAKVTNLKSSIENIETLRKTMYNSTEDMKAYKDAMNTLGEEYPNLISSYDEAGNAIINISAAETALAEARTAGAKAAAEAAIKQIEIYNTQAEAAQSAINEINTIVRQTAVASNPGNIVTLVKDNELPIIAQSSIQNGNDEYDYLTGVAEYARKVNLDYKDYNNFINILDELIANPDIVQQNNKYTKSEGWGKITSEEWAQYKENLLGTSSDISKSLTFNLKDLDKIIADFPNLFGNAKNALEFAGYHNQENLEVTDEILQSIYDQIQGVLKRNQITLESSRKIAEYTTTQGNLFTLSNGLITNPTELNRLQGNNIYSRLFNNIIAGKLDTTKYKNLFEWQQDTEGNYASEMTSTGTEFIEEWYNSLSDAQKDILESIDFTEYLNADDVMNKIGLREDQKSKDIIDAFIQQFNYSVTANRDRILKTVYATDDNNNITNELNKDFEKLTKLNIGENVTSEDAIKTIANTFKEDTTNPIISKYADYFTSQIVSINKLADQGYTALAGTRLTSLYNLSNALSSIEGENASKIQQDLFGIITSIDFSSYEKIIQAQKQIQEYGTKNGIDVSNITSTLAEAATNLIFNVTTLAQEVTNQITSAAKEIDGILSTNKSGLSFDKAIEEFNKLDTAFEEISSFDQVFSYDATLGKYVYTSLGLQKAIENREQQLQEQATKLNEQATKWTTSIKNDERKTVINDRAYTSSEFEEFMSNSGLEKSQYAKEYEQAVKAYLADTSDNVDHTINGFNKYLIDVYIPQLSDASSNAEVLLQEYQANKKNQYYQAIDWSKMVLKTDYSGTNRTLINKLAQELGMTNQKTDIEGNVLFDNNGNPIYEEYTGAWEDVRDTYYDILYDQIYGTDEEINKIKDEAEKTKIIAQKQAAKTAAKIASNGQLKESSANQINNAITEILTGAGKNLSAETISLLQQSKNYEKTFTIGEASGEIISETEAGVDYIGLALEQYDKGITDNILTTIEDRNKKYVEIITASYSKATATQTLLSSGYELDFNTLENSFTGLGLELKNYFDAATQSWNEQIFTVIKDGEEIELQLKDVFTTDAFGKTTIDSWDNYLLWLESQGAKIAEASDDLLAKYYRSYIDSRISNENDLDRNKAAATQITNLSGAKIGDQINISEIKDLLGTTEDKILISTEQELNNYIAQLEKYLSDTNWVQNNAQQAEAIRTAVATWKTKFNKNDAWKGIIAENVSYSAAETLQTALGKKGEGSAEDFMKSLGFYWDSFTKQFIAGEDAVARISEQLRETPIENVEARNSLQALIDNLEDTKKYKSMKALQDVLSNYTNITNEQIATFNTQFEGIDLHKFITKDITGKQTLNVSALRAAMQGMHQDINNLFGEEIASIMDTNMSNLTSAVDYTITGTTNSADMQKFLKNYKNLTGISAENAFSYNDVIDAWTLDPKVLQSYIQAQGQELVNLGLLNSEDLNKYITDNTQKKLAENINISDFLDAENKAQGSQAYNKIKQQISSYLQSSGQSIIEADDLADTYIEMLQQGGSAAIEVMQAVAKAQGRELTASEVESAYRVEIQSIEDAFEQITYGPGGIVSGKAVQILEALEKSGKASITKLGDGGSAVVNSITDIAAAYEEYYKILSESGEATLAALNEAKAKVLETKGGRDKEQAAINALGDASSMTYTTFASIFTDAGIKLTDEIMQQLTADKVIEALGGDKMRIIDFARFAQAMGWKANSPEYISAFKSYNDSLIDMNHKTERNIVEEVSNLKEAKPGDWINLTEFSAAFGRYVEQTVSDYATELRKKGYTQDIVDPEVKEKQQELLSSLSMSLFQYGAQLDNGILKLSENANLLGIAKTLQSTAQEAGMDLQNGFQEIADVIVEIIRSYTDAITRGIEGGLTNVEAADLSGKAKNLGIEQLDFTQTAEGLKLSEQSAIALYTALKKINGLQATLVFDKLRESLEKTNENFKSSSALTNYIVSIRRAINSADSNVSDARLQQYEAELSVAQEILAVRATQEDNSFNFMSNDIPAAQKNPLNYARNWSQALQTLRDAYKTSSGTKNGKTGFIDYEDYYNIITEMNNVAGMSGQFITIGKDIQGNALVLDGSLEAASKAIQAGCDSLTTIDTGDLKVNLGAIGLNISSGAEAMENSVTAGIQAAAKSQVEMLDGLIAMLEIIVAMEQLSDITGDDTQIDLGDIFVVSDSSGEVLDNITQFTDNFDKARNKLLDYVKGDDDLRKRFENTQINFNGAMRSMMDILGEGQNKDELFQSLFGGLTGDDKKNAQKAYQTMLNGLYQAAISGEYDLDDIGASVQKVLKESGVDLSEFVFNVMEDGKVVRTLTFVGETAIEIDYRDEDVRKAVDSYLDKNTKFASNQAEYTAYIQDALNKYKTGKDGQNVIEQTELIQLRTLIGIASNEFVISGDDKAGYTGYYDGKKFEGSNKNALLTLMGEAAMYKDQGLDFRVQIDNGQQVIKGYTTISGIEIAVSLKNGVPQYTYNGKTGSKELVMGLIAKEGRQAEAGTYTFTDDGKEYSVNVTKAIGLNLTYSYYNDGEPHYVYDGYDFGGDYDQMYSYMKTANQLDTKGNGKWQDDKATTGHRVITISEKAKIEIQINQDGTITTTLKLDGKSFDISSESAQAAAQAYIEASSMENFKDISGTGAGSNRTVQFVSGGYTIEAEIDITAGKTTYRYSDGEELYVADRLSDLQAYLDTMNGKDLEAGDSGKSYRIKKYVKGEVEVDIEIVNGKIANKDQLIGKMTEEEIAALEAKLAGNKQTLENPVEAEASSVKIVTEGVDITLDTETLKPTNKYPVEVEASTIKINTSNTGTSENETINLPINDLTATITSYNDEGASKPSIMQDLESIVATVTSYIDGNITQPEMMTNLQNIQAKIISYMDGDGVTDPVIATNLKAIEAIITSYTDGNITEPQMLASLKAIQALVVSYTDQTKDEPSIMEELKNLIAIISGIDGTSAASELDTWIAQQEEKTITIPIETTPPPPTGKAGLESTQETYHNVGDGSLSAIMQDAITTGDQALAQKIVNDINEAMEDVDFTPSNDQINALKLAAEAYSEIPLGQTATSLSAGPYLENLKQEIENGKTSLSDTDKIYLQCGLEMENDAINNLAQEIEEMLPEEPEIHIDDNAQEATSHVSETKKELTSLDGQGAQVGVNADGNANTFISEVESGLNSLNGKVVTAIIRASTEGNNAVVAKGNVGLAKAKGTLMGELGPELYVQNGRYFVAGQNGPEMVDLADDAIVFNHLQTKSLLEKGMSSGRGRAVTNERKAISYAKGNVNGGPAMAGASAALAALKQLRAQWASLAQLSAKDLAGKGGGGGGGGGDKAFIKDLERWYNWLQKIAQLEKEITHQETLRSKLSSDMVPNGRAYYNSLKDQTKKLGEQIQLNTSLLTSQQDYFDKRRNELNNKSPFSKLYTFDTNGQLVYQNNAFEQLSKMSGTDAYGKPNKTPKEQYDYIINTLGIDKKWLQYDSSGNKIKDDDYAAMVQAFWDKVDSDKDEMQNLHDSIEDQKNTILQKMDERNQLLQEMKDNQIEVENQVLEAVEAAAQREIDELQDVKDAFSDTIEDYIGGLQDALDKEQELYNNSQSEADLNTKRRQLDILRRSGGSAAEIASLEEEINTSERDLYFEYQQQEIDAIQDAADRQLEAMEQQIDLMTEQLEYQKLHGLLWAQVADIMKGSPAEIANYIQTNNSKYWGESPLSLQEDMRTILFKAEQWEAFRKDTSDIKTLVSGLYSDQNNAAFDDFTKAMKQQFGNLWTDDSSAAVRDIFMKKLAETGDVTQAIAAVRKSDTYKTIQKAKEDKDNKSKTTTTGGNKKKNTNNDNKDTVVRSYYKNIDDSGHQKYLVYKSGKEVASGGKVAHEFTWTDTGTSGKWQGKCSKCGYTKITYTDPNIKRTNQTFSKGGIVEKTGTALVHAKEGVLTPEQTSILRNEILGNKNTSLMNLLLQFREITAGNASQNDYASIDRGYGSPITIEKAVVEMNVAKLANSYDARQAGKDALNEMVKIARKTGVQGVGR